MRNLSATTNIARLLLRTASGSISGGRQCAAEGSAVETFGFYGRRILIHLLRLSKIERKEQLNYLCDAPAASHTHCDKTKL